MYGIGTLPCSVLLRTPCACSFSMWQPDIVRVKIPARLHTTSGIILVCLVSLMDALNDACVIFISLGGWLYFIPERSAA